jgi:hypothetical protein
MRELQLSVTGKAFIIGLMLIKCARVDTNFSEVNGETEKDNRQDKDSKSSRKFIKIGHPARVLSVCAANNATSVG